MIGKQSVHLNQLINMILEISMWKGLSSSSRKRMRIQDFLNEIIFSFKSGGGRER